MLSHIKELLRGLKKLNILIMREFHHISQKYGRNLTYYAFAFVFIYFGLQKPLPILSPVDGNIALFGYKLGLTHLGLSSSFLIYFVGFYEIFIGLLFLFRMIKQVFWFFLIHQVVSLLSLLILYKNAFQPPWITLLSLDIPVFLNSWSAFVMKNLIFIACFMLIFNEEIRKTGFKDPRN